MITTRAETFLNWKGNRGSFTGTILGGDTKAQKGEDAVCASLAKLGGLPASLGVASAAEVPSTSARPPLRLFSVI